MPKALSITPTHKAVKTYYATLRDLSDQQVSHEQAVRSAFQSLLTDLSKPLKWTAIPELGKKVKAEGKRVRVIPDGTIRDKFQLPRGYWEAKDSADNLDAEITDKRKKGYPLDNTIFWTPARAVLYQGGVLQHDLPIDESNGNPASFCDLLTAFFSYVDKPIVDFDTAVETFTDRVPEVGKKLAEIIAEAHKTNRKFKETFEAFFDLCKTTLNPHISQQAVDEMLVQHLLTKRLFSSVFKNPEFLQKNVIATEVEKVIDALANRHFNPAEFLKELDRFYIAIENAADRVHDWSSKQHFLNTVYERFFQGYCVKTADTHGIVYTPQPIVDFMCASVEWVLEQEFGKKLGDDGVNILDPCTGTGNFVVNLMRRAADRGQKHLKRMYREQLFANEIMLMPYYIAALNIEHEYYEHIGEYEPFEGLCFVDTLDLAEARQHGLFTEENLARVDRQKKSPITVVIGNPPYNARQVNENDNNKNRVYPVVDHRIRFTYSKDSNSTNKTGLNDMFVRFWRWATDRLSDRDGVVAFVTNNSFVDQIIFDGMRKHLAQEFASVYHFDLQGNVRHNPTLAGTQYNVFGIQVGVGVTVAVKRRSSASRGIHYYTVDKYLRRAEKLNQLVSFGDAGHVPWRRITPDDRHTWMIPANAERFAAGVPIGSFEARANEADAAPTIFADYCRGIVTCRDDVVYDFQRGGLQARVSEFVENYNAEVDRYKRTGHGADVDEFVRYDKIKWSRDLKRDLKNGIYVNYESSRIRAAAYRPFSERWLYFDRVLNQDVHSFPVYLPGEVDADQRVCAVTDIGSEKPFMTLLTTKVVDMHLVGAGASCQCFPLYTYDEVGADRRDNITDWALNLFRTHLAAVSPEAAAKARRITKKDIFHYVYGMLHHQGYRDTFAENLKRELPRIPLAKSFADFESFVDAGEKLAKLHLNYDDDKIVKPYKLKEEWTLTDDEVGGGRKRPKSWRVESKMKLSKDKTSVKVNDTLTLHDIPPDVYRYRLGNRSALEWVIDQYQVYTDPKTGITSDCNAWGEERDDPEYIVRLVKQVVTVSLETMKLVDALPKDFGGPPVVPHDQIDVAPANAAAAEDRCPAKGPKFELRSSPNSKQQKLPRK
ncbi:MAG: N-6 DNA methylase [Phycisphaeraceae bacterium]|nr:N-6 DNA methylase [Phycisphaeraceae bacterium]